MQSNTQTNVRMPIKLKKESEKLVKQGYYKSVSELVISSVRNEILKIKSANKEKEKLNLMQKVRQEIWKNYLKRAGGNSRKAIELMQKEAERGYEKNPEFWK